MMATMRKSYLMIGVLVLGALLFSSIGVVAAPQKSFTPHPNQLTVVKLRDLELEVPAGATDQTLTISRENDSLEGIAKPHGFRAVGQIYRFGPAGTKFPKGKELKFRLKFAEYKGEVKLYYINRYKKCLERVSSQYYNCKTGELRAKLEHFSDYVPGVTPSWDGEGINPFMDYISNGEEKVQAYRNKLSVISKVFSVPGRGLDIELTRIYISPEGAIDTADNPFTICGEWRWALTYIYDGKVYLPGGGGLGNSSPDSIIGEITLENKTFEICKFSNATIASYKHENRDDEVDKIIVYLNNGTRIETFGGPEQLSYQIVSDSNGNWVKYTFSKFDYDEDEHCHRITNIIDSVGHQLNFFYQEFSSSRPKFLRLEQKLADNSNQIILTRTAGTNKDSFTDALGRTTVYNYDEKNRLAKIIYPNGAKSEYTYLTPVSYKISMQKFYYPNQTTPFQVNIYDSTTGDSIIKTQTNIKRYTFFVEGDQGLTKTEETLKLSGELLKRITYDYTHQGDGDFYYESPISIKTESYKNDGTLGSTTLYQYQYDNWHNLIKSLDPYGTETRMAYLNSNSNKNLASFNGRYQNYQFPNFPVSVGWNLLATKATLVYDPVHSSNQLRQSHYRYDPKGNLLQESVAHNGSYLDTNYSYDNYGNLLSQTDANGNTLNFEYSPTYQAAYLTRVYKPDNTTIATFSYDFNLGKKITATDPKGNIFRYEYDVLGRLTKEGLDDPTPTIGVNWELAYNDLNSILTMRYGSDSGGWQEGKIDYDPLFGKPKVLWRKLNGNWIKIKQFEFDTAGRAITEQDNLGHTTSYEYDEFNRKTKVTSPDYQITRFSWNDRTLTSTDANGVTRTQVYDLLNRLVMVQERPDAGTTLTTSYTYDNFEDQETKEQDSHLVQVINPRTAAMQYNYDDLGQLVRTDYPQDGPNPMVAETYIYDNVGNLLSKTDSKGTKSMIYEYFASYRLKQITEADGRVVINTYDNNDNLVTQSFPGGLYEYKNNYNENSYDARNRPRFLKVTLEGHIFNFGYEYDVFGRITTINYPNRSNPVTYQYDELDRLQSIPDFVNSCSYDGDNKLIEMLLANGLKNTYIYDINDRPIQLGSGGFGTLVSLCYSFDPVGNVSRINGDHYGYDGLNRLVWAGNLPQTQLTSPWGKGTAWSYDGAGNRTNHKTYSGGVMQESIDYSYDLANRLLSKGNTTYSNDSAGSRITKTVGSDTWSYLYDGEARLTQVLKNGTGLVQNSYDGLGMRTKKVGADGKTTYYVYSEANPILEFDLASGKYTYYIYAGSKSIAEESGMVKTFYHRDHLGSTRATTDQNGKVTGLCKYDAWGKLESTNEYDEGVINGDFEMATDLGQVSKWIAGGNDCSYVAGSGQNGSHGLKIERTSGSSYWFLPNVYASPDTDYELSGYFYSGNEASISAKALIIYRDSSGAVLATNQTELLGYSNGWKPFTLASHAPAAAAYLEIRLAQGSETGQVVYFDGIRLKIPGLAGKYDFTGKKLDEECGLSYFGARFYDAEVGRFINQDPAKDGVNWFGYCECNPVKYADPYGLEIVKRITVDENEWDSTRITTEWVSDALHSEDPKSEYQQDQAELNSDPEKFARQEVLIDNQTGMALSTKTYAYGKNKGKEISNETWSTRKTGKYVADIAKQIKERKVSFGFLGLGGTYRVIANRTIGEKRTCERLWLMCTRIRNKVEKSEKEDFDRAIKILGFINSII